MLLEASLGLGRRERRIDNNKMTKSENNNGGQFLSCVCQNVTVET